MSFKDMIKMHWTENINNLLNGFISLFGNLFALIFKGIRFGFISIRDLYTSIKEKDKKKDKKSSDKQ